MLAPRALAIFRELFVWRDQTAEALDRAAFRVMGNEAMFALAAQPPQSLRSLAQVRGVGRDLVERRGADILAAVERGLGLPESAFPRFSKPRHHRPDPAFERRLERLKALRTSLAARFELAPGVLCPNWLLESIARSGPADLEALAHIEGMRRWQLAEFGVDLLAALA